MKKWFLSTLMLVICLSRLSMVAIPAGMPESFGHVQSQREHIMQPPKSMKEESSAALQEEPVNSSSRREDIDEVKTPRHNQHTSSGHKAGREAEKRIVEAHNSGLKGTTTSVVVSGIPGGQRTRRPTSIEFAIAPIEGGKPAYHKAIVVKSDHQGAYTVALPPGAYWIGPKAKALDPINYRPGVVVFPEQEAVVKAGVFTQLDLVEVGYAP
jgi:hypothetical protein